MSELRQGISAADTQPVAGLLAAQSQDQPYQAPADLKQPIIPSSAAPGKSTDATSDGASAPQRLTASGPSGISKAIAAHVQGPVTPDVARRAGVPAEYIPIMNWIASGEAHSFNQLYREGQTFSDMSDHPANLGWPGDTGPDGRPTHAAGLPQWEPRTWNQARSEWNSLHPDDQVHDFSDVSQTKVWRYWIDKNYGGEPGQIVLDLSAGKTDRIVSALRGQWPSLDKGGDRDRQNYAGATAYDKIYQDERRDSQATIARLEQDRQRVIDEATKADPNSARRQQMLEEAHEHTKELTKLYEEDMKSPPVKGPTDLFAGWGGIVIALAALAGRRSSQPLTASLNGMAGAMDAMNQGNQRDFENRFKVWEKQTDYALKAIDIQNTDIRNILEDQRISDDERQARLRVAYELGGYDRDIAAQRAGDYRAQWELQIQRDTMAQRAVDKTESARRWYADYQQREEKKTPIEQYALSLDTEWKQEHPGEPMPESVKQEHLRQAQRDAGAGQAGRLPPETLERMAKQYVRTGDKSVLTGLGYGNAGAANRADLQAAITKEMEESGVPPEEMGVRIAEFQGIMAGERTLGTRTANIGMAVSSAQKMLPLVKTASEQTPRTEYPTLNEWLLGAEKQLGDTGPITLRVAVNSFLNAYSRAVAPTGVPTDDVRKHAYELLEVAYNKGQFIASLDQMSLEMKAEQQAPGEVRSEFRKALLAAVAKDQAGGSAGKLPADLPSPTGHVEGSTAKDESGKVVAIIRNGQWTPP